MTTKKTRKFGGRTYKYITTYGSKREAKKQAERQRQSGRYLVRVAKVADGWATYGRTA